MSIKKLRFLILALFISVIPLRQACAAQFNLPETLSIAGQTLTLKESKDNVNRLFSRSYII